jgi:hypothetical protein
MPFLSRRRSEVRFCKVEMGRKGGYIFEGEGKRVRGRDESEKREGERGYIF